jgi:hypothetical protein
LGLVLLDHHDFFDAIFNVESRAVFPKLLGIYLRQRKHISNNEVEQLRA